MLLAHMDITPVQAESESSWSHPPFDGAIADGFIWGRGTLDMKGPLTGIMEAVEQVDRVMTRLRGIISGEPGTRIDLVNAGAFSNPSGISSVDSDAFRRIQRTVRDV